MFNTPLKLKQQVQLDSSPCSLAVSPENNLLCACYNFVADTNKRHGSIITLSIMNDSKLINETENHTFDNFGVLDISDRNVFCCSDGCIRSIDTNGQCETLINYGDTCCLLCQESDVIAAGCQHGHLHTPMRVGKNAHSDCIWCVRKLNDQNLLATCSDDKQIKIWDCRCDFRKAETVITNAHQSGVCSILQLPCFNQYTLLSCSFDGWIKNWDIKMPHVCKNKIKLDGELWKIKWLDNILVVVSMYNGVFVIDNELTKSELMCPNLNNELTYDCMLLPDKKTFALCKFYGKSIEIWN
ncbi:hypothetical protein GJ496_001037 [Pomphorhynchus laevis]|nr:hypothetical protein GJ496_001037 [Pomphorhynchus laevis]